MDQVVVHWVGNWLSGAVEQGASPRNVPGLSLGLFWVPLVLTRTCLFCCAAAEEAIAAVKRDGVTKLVVLPLYPQFSVSTSGSSLRLLETLLKEDPVLRQVRGEGVRGLEGAPDHYG